jgi:hypothetical protein
MKIRKEILGDRGFDGVCGLAVEKAEKARSSQTVFEDDIATVTGLNDRESQSFGSSAQRSISVLA